MQESKNFVVVFRGSELSVNLLKKLLVEDNIESIIKNQQDSANLAGFWTSFQCELLINDSNLENAQPLIQEFSERSIRF